jgi:hypothetical protein
LNSAENRLRVLMVGHPSHQRIHLSRLCQEVGPPLISPTIFAVEEFWLINPAYVLVETAPDYKKR